MVGVKGRWCQEQGVILQTTPQDHLVAWLAALAIVIHIAESALPSPLPGAKPGLANVITVVVLMTYGARMAVWVSLLRVIVGSLLLGSFLTPGFALSLSGALCSLILMSVLHFFFKPYLSAIGISLAAALGHMTGQFFTAYLFFIPHPGMFKLLPVLLTMAGFFGLIGGLVANRLLHDLQPEMFPHSDE